LEASFCKEAYFCEVLVRNGKTAKRDNRSPKYPIFSFLPTDQSFTHSYRKNLSKSPQPNPVLHMLETQPLDIGSNSRITFGAAGIRRRMHAWKLEAKEESKKKGRP
jgi:hypothetical protein